MVLQIFIDLGSGRKTSDAGIVYTYQEPTINTSVNIATNPQNANTSNTFNISGTNNRAWSSYENAFQTHYRIRLGSASYSSWTNLGNITSWSRTAAQMRTLVPKTYDGQTNTIQFRRYSPSANWYSTNTASGTFIVYYRPRIAVNESNVTYRQNNSSGTIVSKNQLILASSSLSGIYVSWVYDETQPQAGYVQGYRIRLYDEDSNIVETYYTASKNYVIPKADIPKLQTTYIDITPYFANDTTDPNNYWYQSGTVTKMEFVRIVSSLSTPVIQYPVNGSNWINTDYRVCLTLPSDPDYGEQDEATYHYEDIELQINNTFTIRLTDSALHTTTGTNLIATQCFSALVDNLTYRRKIIIYPKLASGFPISSSYTLRVRVKKKYYTSSSITGWSSWSNSVTISVTEPNYDVTSGDLILASHFNGTLDLIYRIASTYGVSWTTRPETARPGITVITANDYNYNNMMCKLVETKNQVNNYGTYDTGRDNIQFDVDNNIPTTFTPVVGELVTAEANEDNSPNGRNYMQIIYDKSIYLK